MRRSIAALVATIAGLVILLSFKTAPVKSARPVALAGTTPSSPTGPDVSSSGPASPGAASSDPAASDPASAASSAAPPTATPSAASHAPAAATHASSTPKAAASKKPTPTPTPTKPATTTKTVTGSSVQVSEGGRVFGNVQVRVTVTNGKITALTAVDYPNNDRHSSQISSYSIPILSQEVLAAQGTQINAVSGATYTSDAYAQSVQSALDAAKA